MDDSSDINDLTFDEKIAVLEEDLPGPIRSFLHSPERDATSLRLSQKYRLHADQAAAFEGAYLYMLLGVNSPHDFVEDLRAAGIDAESIRGLTNDINEEVFKRLLQKEFQEADRPKTAPIRQPAPSQVPVLNVAPPPPSFNLAAQAVKPPEPLLRTMQTDMSALQHRTTAAPIPFPFPHPAQMTPAMSFHSASIPYTTAPTPVQSRPLSAPVIAPSKPIPSPTLQPSGSGGDPYRETI